MKLQCRGVLAAAILCAYVSYVNSCTCSIRHPQEQACGADFVLVVRIRSELKSGLGYKIKVKRELKVKEKAAFALRKGVLWTNSQNSTCGVSLEKKGTYLVAGTLQGRKPYLSYCDFRSEWRNLTPRQKKGFKLLYYNNCMCSIQDCPSWMYCPKFPQACNWNTAWEKLDCEGKHAICMQHEDASCKWKFAKKYFGCSKALKRLKKYRLRARKRQL